MSSLSITAIIVIAAVCGGVAVLCITGLTFLLIYRRRQERFLDDLGRTRLNQHHDGDVDLREVEIYTADTTNQGSSPHWKRLKAHVYGHKTSLGPKKDSPESRIGINRQASTRETSQGYRIVPNGGDADQIDLEPVEADELADIYLPAEKPETAPLTPISERDTPDSSRRALPRQGYQSSSNSKKLHRLAQPGRNLSPSCFSDSSSASSNKLSKQNRFKAKGKAKSTTDLIQPRVLRSLSFRSERDGCKCHTELPPSPDAIYDACSRLSPSSSQRLGKVEDRHGSDSDAVQTHSTKSSVFDGHGSYTTTGSNFPSLGTSSKRDSKRDLHPDTFVAESFKARAAKRFSRQSPILAGSSPITDTCHSSSKDILPPSNQRYNLTENEISSPVKDWQSSLEKAVSTVDQTFVLDSNPQHVGSLAKRNSRQSFKFWRERTSKAKKIASSKKGKAQALQESTSKSNRRSLSMSPKSLPKTKTIKINESCDSENLDHNRSDIDSWQRQRRTSIHKPHIDNLRSNGTATSTLRDAGVSHGSAARHSILLPEIELQTLTSGKSSRRNSISETSSMRQAYPIDSKDKTTRRYFVEFHQDLVGPSALWSIIGDQSDASESAKPEVHESPSAFSFEDSEDILHLSHDRKQSARHFKAKRRTNSRSQRSYMSSSPSRSSNETFEVKAPSPLRPRSSILADSLLIPSRTLSSPPPSSNLEDLASAAIELPHSLRIGSATRIGKAVSRQTSQCSAERRRSRESPSGRKSRDLGPSRDQLIAASGNMQKLSRFTNAFAPPSHPPPPPPPTTARSQARMTSMMMELRRQNSDSSRYDSSYFKLPRSQRASHSSQRASLNDPGINQTSSRSSRSYGVGNGNGNEVADRRQGLQAMLNTKLDNAVQSRSGLWDRRAGRERDPFLENGTRNYQNFSRPQPFVITSPNYLPGYEPESLSTQKNILEQLEQQHLIGQAVELGMSPEPILLLEHGRESSSTELRRTPTDESENDLSPMGKTIMAETRREQYGLQQRKGSLASTRASSERQWSLHSPPPLSPPHSQYFQRPLPRPSTSPSAVQFHLVRPTHHHRRNKSSISSAGRSNSSGHNEPSQTELKSFRSWSLAEGRKSRRETQRQRVEMLKERVASMEFAKKGKAGPL